MKVPRNVIVLIQACLAIGLMAYCTWNEVPWFGSVAVGVLIVLAMAASIPRGQNRWAAIFEVIVSWVCATLGVIALIETKFNWSDSGTLVTASLAGAVAIGMIPAALASEQSGRRRNWKLQVVFWCFFGAWVLLSDGCKNDERKFFFAGLVLSLLILIGCKLWFRPPQFFVLIENTIILLLIGLPIADRFVRPPIHTRLNGTITAPYYECESVTHPGTVYKCWSPLISFEWDRMRRTIINANHAKEGPEYRFKPNSKFRFYECDLRINNLGFRGRDVAAAKGNAFRIVAIGESTTFGITLKPGERSWPDLLEEMIRTRLDLPRPVEVINAGFPASTIEDSLWRIDQEILALKPDMIISYHGINGFHLLDKGIPPLSDPDPPKYMERPLKLIANLEFRWKVNRFNKRRLANIEQHPPLFENVMKSRYAADTRRLVDVCRTNHIDLVIGTFSLAVNSKSEKEVVDFYHGIYPEVPSTIRANVAYTAMLDAMVREESMIHLVDTHPGLDGDYSKFTDLMHLTQAGRQKVADAFFDGIKDVLRTEVKAER